MYLPAFYCSRETKYGRKARPEKPHRERDPPPSSPQKNFLLECSTQKTCHLSNESLYAMDERVPIELQAVFLASSRGKEVHQPPPRGIASKSFKPKTFWQRLKSEIIHSPRRKPKPTCHSSEFRPEPPLTVSEKVRNEFSVVPFLIMPMIAAWYHTLAVSFLPKA